MADNMKVLERYIHQTNVRHGVITSNLANVDTPNYRAKDVSFGKILGSELALASTDPKHLPGAEGNAAGTFTIEDTQPWADKNNVELDLEVAKMTENAMQFQAGLTLLMKKVTMFKNALRTST